MAGRFVYEVAYHNGEVSHVGSKEYLRNLPPGTKVCIIVPDTGEKIPLRLFYDDGRLRLAEAVYKQVERWNKAKRREVGPKEVSFLEGIN